LNHNATSVGTTGPTTVNTADQPTGSVFGSAPVTAATTSPSRLDQPAYAATHAITDSV
jgi:hypothetical protein